LLDSLRALQLRYTTSLHLALLVLENYPAKIVISELPLDESLKLLKTLESNDIATIALLPSTTTKKEIQGIQGTI